MFRWLWWFFRDYTWECVYFSGTLEVEHNYVTNHYRYRNMEYGGEVVIEGPWVPGLPHHSNGVTLDDLLPTREMAMRLAPMARKADNDEKGI